MKRERKSIPNYTFAHISFHFNSNARYFNGTIFQFFVKYKIPFSTIAAYEQSAIRICVALIFIAGNWWCFFYWCQNTMNCHTFQCIFSLNRIQQMNGKRNCFQYSMGFSCGVSRMSLAYLKLKAIHLNWWINQPFDCEMLAAITKPLQLLSIKKK